MDEKLIKKLIIGGVIGILILIVCVNSCSIVGPRERGVTITLGKAGDTVMEPGFNFKAPFVQKVKKFDLEPKEVLLKIGTSNDAAVSKDMQEVGLTAVVNYTYDETRIMDILKNYSESKLKDLVQNAFINDTKSLVGEYSLTDIVAQQKEIKNELRKRMDDSLSQYPIHITQLTLDNWDWPDSYNKMIQETMVTKQMAEKAKQDLAVAEQTNQAKVIAAQADLEAEKLAAEQKKVKADAEAYEMRKKNEAIQQTLAIQRESWAHEEKMKYYEKWDGHLEGANAANFIVTPNYSGLKIDTK